MNKTLVIVLMLQAIQISNCNALCPSGYKLNIGDIRGWGTTLGSALKLTRQECANRCSKLDGCKSFEHSYTQGKCNINTLANPTTRKYKDYAFCTKQDIKPECPKGYILRIGDIPGWGSYLGSALRLTRQQCAGRCSTKMTCRSFEHSYTEGKCNLNLGPRPTTGKYKDYAFCSKPDSCPSGYTMRFGDVPGWGTALGSALRMDRQECANRCSKLDGCKSFEHSYTEGKCNLNTVHKPINRKYKDYDFCSKNNIKPECPTGYILQDGDIPGWGTTLGSALKLTRQECANRCSKLDGCKSFEHSYTEGKCNINVLPNPVNRKYKDYAFCTVAVLKK